MAEIENSKFKFYKNKILVGISDNDLQKIKQASENFSIYFKSKSCDKNLGLEVEMNPLESKDYYIYINPYCRKDLFDGKLESLEQIIKPNLEFLTHRFTYTNTLKDFTNILQKGKFECIEQYDEKDIFEYIKKQNKNNSYNEVGKKYIGTGEAYSKLNYYPTSLDLQYKLLPYMLPITVKEDTLIKKSILKFLEKNNLSTRRSETLYNELLKIGRYDLIDEIFRTRNLQYEYSSQNRLVIADLFAGEGEWLSLFKKYTSYSESYLVANEIEENRWKKCCEKKFQFKPTNYAYEELKQVIPEKFINIMLFNPPYGVNNEGRRNVVAFLEMLMKDNYLQNEACVAFVINIDDFNSCKHLLAKHFIINKDSFNTLSVDDKENKLKQICFVATKKTEQKEGSYNYNQEMLDLNNADLTEKHVLVYNYSRYYYKPIEIYEKFDNLKFKYNRDMYNTNLESPLWINAVNNLTVDTFTGKKIKLPDKPDNLGIVANLISSGLINGEIYGEHPHSIAAGITEKITEEFDEENNSYIITKKQIPFCSILSGMQVINMTGDDEEEIITEEEIVSENYYEEAS